MRTGGHSAVVARVDKPRKEEAAGVLERAMGKVRGRLGQPLDLVAADSVAGDRSAPRLLQRHGGIGGKCTRAA